MKDKYFEDMVGAPIAIGSKVLYSTMKRELYVGEVTKMFFASEKTPYTPTRRVDSVSIKPFDGGRVYNLKSKPGNKKFRILVIHDELYKEIELSLIQNQLI